MRILFVLAPLITLVYCSTKSPDELNKEDLIGKWKLITIDENVTENESIWEFNEDGTYSIAGAEFYEEDHFYSSPFRGRQRYHGYYSTNTHDLVINLKIREKYRGPHGFIDCWVYQNELKLESYIGNHSETIVLKFQKL